MPTRRLPRTNNERYTALRTAKERKDAVAPADVPLMAATQTLLDSGFPAYRNLQLAVRSARAQQTEQSAITDPLRRSARMWVNHGYQALINATLREEFPTSVLSYYNLANTAKGAPDMRTEQGIISAYNDYVAGESARVMAGGTAIPFPDQVSMRSRVDAFKAANLTQAALKDAHDNAQEALAAASPDADKLILRLWNEIEAAFDTGDKPSMRRRAREWGVIYVPSAGETPSPEDYSIKGIATDAATGLPMADVEVSLDGTTITATTDSEGRYYLPATTAGSYTLRASKEGYATAAQPVTVTDGTIAEVNVALTPEVTEE